LSGSIATTFTFVAFCFDYCYVFCVALNFRNVANAGCLMQRELSEAKQSGVQLQPLLAVAIDVANVASANLFCKEISGFKVKIVFELLCLLFNIYFECCNN
jgi:hypothetical protein